MTSRTSALVGAAAIALAFLSGVCDAEDGSREPSIQSQLGPCAELSGEPAIAACRQIASSELPDTIKASAFERLCIELYTLARWEQAAEACERRMELIVGHEFRMGPMLVLGTAGYDNLILGIIAHVEVKYPLDDPGALVMLGWLFDLMGRDEEALEVLGEAGRLLPDDAFVLARTGLVLADLGRTEEGLAEIQVASRLEPENAAVRVAEGKLLYHMERFEQSVAALQTAIELDSTRADAHAELVGVYSALHHPLHALASARAAVRLAPGDSYFWGLLGWTAASSGEYQEALTAFRRALALNPLFFEAHPEMKRVWSDLQAGEEPVG